MADSQETKVLKDINRHLSSISDNQKGLGDKLSPSETAAMNKNVKDIMGNFESLLDARLKRTVLVTDRAISEAFGNLKGFNLDQSNHQIGLLDDVIYELEANNRFMAKAEQNDFLKEAERETDLNINRRTNDLLEDLIDKEEEANKITERSEREANSFLGGGAGGLFGGLFAGKSIRGLLGGLKGAGKKIFFPLLIAGAATEFLRGWAEAGEDAATIDKFNSGISRTLSDLTFGLVSKEFFQNALVQIEGQIGKAWEGFTKNWNDLVKGKITAPDFFANIISGLTAGNLSPEQIKMIGQQVEDGMVDLVKTITDAIVAGIVKPLVESVTERFGLLFDDPIQFFKNEWEAIKKKQAKDAEEALVATQKLQAEGLSESAARQQAIMDKGIEKLPFIQRVFAKSVAKPLLNKLGFGTETQEEALAKEAAKQAAAELKAKKESNRAARLAEDRKRRLDEIKGVKAAPRPMSDIGTEGLKQKVELEAAKTEIRNAQEPKGALQINNNSNSLLPVDRSTENDDAVNLIRTAGGF